MARAACGTTCGTLGGSSFDPVAVTSHTDDRGSTNATGRHGASNLWGKWPKRGSPAGITARAPYNIGQPTTPRTLAGSTLHHTGLGLGTHGHGVGVVPAAIGGPHNARTETATVSLTRGPSGGFQLQSNGICLKCFGTWFVAGAIVLLLLLFSGR